MLIAKVWKKVKDFDGLPKESDFELVEEQLSEDLKPGEVLVEAEWISLDPYQRRVPCPSGSTMVGRQIAKVLTSRNEAFPVNSFIFGEFGWRTYTIFDPTTRNDRVPPFVLENIGDLPRSLALGVLGLPGNSGYFGFLELCSPKEGETLVVSAAAGAVGSLVGQIGKIKGLNVIGIAGSDHKCVWLVNELGFDGAINYRTSNILQELKKLAPNGVDCYFDNVGGQLTSSVITHMNEYGRVSVCGSISAYHTEEQQLVPDIQKFFNWKQLRMEGFMIYRWRNRWAEGTKQLTEWVKEGKIKYRETVTNGIENAPRAFISMLTGGNIGKAVLKV